MEHVAEADAILKVCSKEWPKVLPYLLEPSNLLALGGLRGVSPYVTFGKQNKTVQSAEFVAFLKRFGLRLIREETNYGPKFSEPIYMLIHTGALAAVPDQYKAVADWWVPEPKAYDHLNYLEWYLYNMTACQAMLEKGKLPKHWLAEWWAPHNLCFGMLLGYPGSAICSFAAADMVQKSLNVAPDTATIEFRYPVNSGVKVAYDAQKIDMSSRQIAAHQKRWQDFFDLIYSAW